MELFSNFQISASGLSAQRLRMDVISNNIANVNTTRGIGGAPYQRQRVVFEPRGATPQFLLPFSSKKTVAEKVGEGVRVVGVAPDPSPAKLVYDPGHPDANANGYVSMPNVNIVNEMVDMLSATRAYEANVTAINSAKSMAMKALDIGRV
jgi:flagellar basal-body rod protein FlgC